MVLATRHSYDSDVLPEYGALTGCQHCHSRLVLSEVQAVEESYPTPHIHEQMTTSNYGYDTAYNFTHNNIMLEPNAMNNIDTVAHMNVHNTQY